MSCLVSHKSVKIINFYNDLIKRPQINFSVQKNSHLQTLFPNKALENIFAVVASEFKVEVIEKIKSILGETCNLGLDPLSLYDNIISIDYQVNM